MSYTEHDAMRDFTREVAGHDLTSMPDEDVAKLARSWQDRAVDIRTGCDLDASMANIVRPLIIFAVIAALIWMLV